MRTASAGFSSRVALQGGGSTEVDGGKFEVSDSGSRVPCLLKWRGHISPRTTVNAIADLTDVLPTLAEAAGRSDLLARQDLTFPSLVSDADGNPSTASFFTDLDGVSLWQRVVSLGAGGADGVFGQDARFEGEKQFVYVQYRADAAVRTRTHLLREDGSFFDVASLYQSVPITYIDNVCHPERWSQYHELEIAALLYMRNNDFAVYQPFNRPTLAYPELDVPACRKWRCPDGVAECRGCISGFTFDGNGGCLQCRVEHCKACDPDSLNRCTNCEGPFVLSESGKRCL